MFHSCVICQHKWYAASPEILLAGSALSPGILLDQMLYCCKGDTEKLVQTDIRAMLHLRTKAYGQQLLDMLSGSEEQDAHDSGMNCSGLLPPVF